MRTKRRPRAMRPNNARRRAGNPGGASTPIFFPWRNEDRIVGSILVCCAVACEQRSTGEAGTQLFRTLTAPRYAVQPNRSRQLGFAVPNVVFCSSSCSLCWVYVPEHATTVDAGAADQGPPADAVGQEYRTSVRAVPPSMAASCPVPRAARRRVHGDGVRPPRMAAAFPLLRLQGFRRVARRCVHFRTTKCTASSCRRERYS